MKHSSRKKTKEHHQKSLHEFYTEEQKHAAHKEKKRRDHEQIEMEIFEHLKEHTKKILKKYSS